MKKKQKILLIISCTLLILILIICVIIKKKSIEDENIEKNEINNSISNSIIENNEDIIIVGIKKKEENKEETNNENVEGIENQSEDQNVIQPNNNIINRNEIHNVEKDNMESTRISTIESQPENITHNNEVGKSAEELTQEIYSLNSNIGTLYIPKTKLNTSVYCNSSVSQMEKMPCFLYTNGGINKKGITLIVGHNRRNWKIFSNNKKIEQGDVFYFTDLEGKKLKYIVYSKFITKENDTAFLNGDFDVPTIALSCCTDASDDNRIIILGKAE